jgi:choline-sulfatase
MNVLFLMADEFRHDAAGFGGNAIARTPHLDALAAGAAVFDNAYTASPVCIPARQCLATGKYPLHIGCEEFGEDIAPGSQTFARSFADAGYYTVACGKLHHRGPDPMQGWIHRIGSETAIKWPEAYSARPQVGRRKWRGALDLQSSGVGVSPLGIHDDYTVRGACDFLRIHYGGMYEIPVETPLLLMVSLQQPHFPLLADQDLFDYYHRRVEPYLDQTPPANPSWAAKFLGKEQGVTDDDIRMATAAYYALVERTDQRIGQVLQSLREVGQNLDEWLVVFASDHGDMLGQHGMWEKRSFYEGSARVPLFLRGPGISAGRKNTPANLVDLYPTLCARAGVAAPSDLDGADLLTAEDSRTVFCQYGRKHFMVRSGRWKYITLEPGEELLFDLQGDPTETRNLIAAEASQPILAQLRGQLADFRRSS